MAKQTTQLLNALDLLSDQHRDVDGLFEKVEGDGSDRTAAFLELADTIAAHATIEEKLFYPRVMSDETSDLLHKSVEEHLAIKRVLADMLTMDLEASDFAAKLSVLKEEFSHHAHEVEEQELFPIVRETMDEDELAALGNELLVMFEDLMPSSPRMQVPTQTGEAAPLHA
jgi:hemerythrin superfamily protein